jgi:hypothetical protein
MEGVQGHQGTNAAELMPMQCTGCLHCPASIRTSTGRPSPLAKMNAR